jgi:hypothetical protein
VEFRSNTDVPYSTSCTSQVSRFNNIYDKDVAIESHDDKCQREAIIDSHNDAHQQGSTHDNDGSARDNSRTVRLDRLDSLFSVWGWPAEQAPY